ncbi:hypothetical protein WICMUC_001994 [Wickerhamomyces mucosus]|uniref:Alpha-1,3/1,6-mannosyltransferase ALG2 n=1 Tax=Wickerhamomyces mucosus TaxID=1378264 RepID=A0A9P8PQ56_9ASCO|nr:hypothetical protein WICMUC_001994 [Wickerhamomyces mucosus]
MRVAFLHPDLGIGGAERLIVDAASGLQDEGHEILIYTSHCDKTHCFEEVQNGRLKVKVIGDWLPTSFLGKFKILFAFLRQLVLVLTIIFTGEIKKHDFFIIDQLSYCVPLLHLFHSQRAKILFYCHFPDLKLANHSGLLRSLYRAPFDIIEQFSMSASDGIVVNSRFTRSIYDDSFKFLKDLIQPDVIYPCVDITTEEITKETDKFFNQVIGKDEFFVSINRFEIKKNIELAIDSYIVFKSGNPSNNTKLIISGGYDHLNPENKIYLDRLVTKVSDAGLKSQTIFQSNHNLESNTTPASFEVLFLPSVTSNLKELLISRSKLLLYTPSFEHFGIVPLEAMKVGTPVLAINNGGPVESIISIDDDFENGIGYLIESKAELWANKLKESLELDKSKIIVNSQRQLNSNFTKKVMINSFELEMVKLLKTPKKFYIWEYFRYTWKLPLLFGLKYLGGINSTFIGTLAIISVLKTDIFQIVLYAIVIYLYFAKFEWFEDFNNIRLDASKAFG